MEIAIITILLIVVILLSIFSYNTYVMNRDYEKTIINIRKNLKDTHERLILVDNNGAFESDDEVGFVFSYILNQIKELNSKYNQNVKEDKRPVDRS